MLSFKLITNSPSTRSNLTTWISRQSKCLKKWNFLNKGDVKSRATERRAIHRNVNSPASSRLNFNPPNPFTPYWAPKINYKFNFKQKRFYSSKAEPEGSEKKEEYNSTSHDWKSTDQGQKKQSINWDHAKRLFRLLLVEKNAALITCAALALTSAGTLFLPKGLGSMIDSATRTLQSSDSGQKQDQEQNPIQMQELPVATLTSIIVGVLVVICASSFVRVYVVSAASQRIINRLRKQLLGALIVRNTSFFDTVTSGELVSRLSLDTDAMSRGLLVDSIHGVRRVLEGIGGLGCMLYISPQLTMWMCIVIPPAFIGTALYGRKIREMTTKLTDSVAAVTLHAEQRLSAIRTVRVFAQEEREINAYSEKLDKVYDIARKTALYNATFISSVFLAVGSALVFVLFQGASLVVAGTLSAGDMTAFLMYSTFTGLAFNGVGNLYSDLIKAVAASDRVFRLIDGSIAEQHEITSNKNLKTLENVAGSIQLKDVTFAYPTRPDITILNGINFNIAPGKVIAVVGNSGSGKSTIAALCTRLYDVSSGEILIDQTPIRDLDPVWLRKQIGVVPQDIHLFVGSIADNISYGNPLATEEQIIAAAKEANAHDFITSFPDGYKTSVGDHGSALSGGQKQRIGIARALLKNPKILILDEATSALDSQSEALIQATLEKAMVGRTVLIIAHRLSTIKNADEIIVLNEGKVAEAGTWTELTSKPDGFFNQFILPTQSDAL